MICPPRGAKKGISSWNIIGRVILDCYKQNFPGVDNKVSFLKNTFTSAVSFMSQDFESALRFLEKQLVLNIYFQSLITIWTAIGVTVKNLKILKKFLTRWHFFVFWIGLRNNHWIKTNLFGFLYASTFFYYCKDFQTQLVFHCQLLGLTLFCLYFLKYQCIYQKLYVTCKVFPQGIFTKSFVC